MRQIKTRSGNTITSTKNTMKNKYEIKGKLIIVEGIDGSGKST